MRATPHPGRLTLAEADQQALRQVVASGSQAAPAACRLLQFYEPACRCLLPAPSSAAQAARPLSAAAPLPAKPGQPLLSEAHPNPANQTVAFNYQLPDTQGEVRLTVGEWAGGLYVGSLEVNGRVLATRKLVVMH